VAPVPDHALAPAQTARRLATDPAHGLTAAEAAARLQRDGPNAIARADGPSAWRILVAQLTSPMLLLLAAAGVVSVLLGDVVEAAVILGVVVLNAAIGLRQEYRAERAIAALQALATPVVEVVRDGRAQTIDARDLVAGDVVLLDAGDRVPADGRVVEAHALRVEESALTGESQPARKSDAPVAADTPLAERTSMAYAGTSIAAGRGRIVVTATGMEAELGRLAGMLGGGEEPTPLQRRLDALVRALALAAVAIVAVVSLLGAARGEALDDLVLTAVSLAVAAIPESLPAVVTVALAIGAQRMLARHALVRRLYAVETLGSVTTICSDKTGTLTQNRMTVVVLDMAGDRRELSADEDAVPDGPALLQDRPTLRRLLAAGALCNDADVTAGDPTEIALVVAAARHGLDQAELEEGAPRIAERPFDATRKRMTTVHAVRDGGAVSFTKGAIDGLLDCCTRVEVHGAQRPLDAGAREGALAAADGLARDGVRVLGIAMRVWPDAGAVPTDERLESELTLLGLAGMIDPARPEVRAALATCRAAGVRTVMITGDHPVTATAIARDLGLADAGAPTVTGPDLERLDDAALAETVRRAAVFARVVPEDKLRIVRALQADGEVVAMTGDGVNDAPALEQADIGVAMGQAGTDVARDAADMVLQDDNFASIVGAVEQGRVVFDNVRKFIRNILSGNLAEVGVMVLGPLAGMPIPLLPLQILWLNLVTDGLPAMAMATEPPEPDVMRRPPTPLAESLFGRDRGAALLRRGGALLVLTLVPTWLLWDAGDDAWQSVLFTAIALAELAGTLAMRSERVPFWRLGPLGNRPLVAAIVGTVALQVAVVTIGPARDVLDLEPMAAGHWLLAVGIALAYFVVVEIDKAARARRRK
jgi:Ca2+-transporting ATPase